jgi:hypothetical protein
LARKLDDPTRAAENEFVHTKTSCPTSQIVLVALPSLRGFATPLEPATMELLQRARESGRVIPSLVTNDSGTIEVDGFGPDLLALLDGTGTLDFCWSPFSLTID